MLAQQLAQIRFEVGPAVPTLAAWRRDIFVQ